MRFIFVTRPNEAERWGGDLLMIGSLASALRELGHDVALLPDVGALPDADHLFLSNTCIDLRPSHNLLQLTERPYGLIGFHEDTILHFGPSYGLYHYIQGVLLEKEDEGISFSLERLYEHPDIIYYYALPPRRSNLINYPLLKSAHLCIANSHVEASTILRDCPSASVRVVPLTCGLEFPSAPTLEFLELAGLTSGGYILQVGRMELRKNQLASILATKDLDIPLVFIATQSPHPFYEQACILAALKWRKAPTLIISQTLEPLERGPVRVIPMPGGVKLSGELLHSAYAHAGLLLHPAFYELPGYTYLEAAKLGLPVVASLWGSIQEYCKDLGDRLAYCLPYDLPAIQACVERQWGRKFSPCQDHPIFRRTPRDLATDFLGQL